MLRPEKLSNSLSGDADAAGPGSTLRIEPPILENRNYIHYPLGGGFCVRCDEFSLTRS